MDRWDQVEATLRAQFEVVAGGAGWVELRYAPGPEESAPPIRARVATGELLGRAFIAIVAEVFERAALEPELALAINHALPFGALELANDTFLVRAMLPLIGLSELDLELAVTQICVQAAHMRRPRGDATATPAFAHWSE